MSGGIVDSAGASATTIKNAVWNALTSAHTTVGSFGVLLKDELAKFGTLVNTGGTATLGGMIGDTANSTIVQRLDAIPTGGGGGKQTQLSQDSAKFLLAASTTLSIQPAVGEYDTISTRGINDAGEGVYEIKGILTDGTTDSWNFFLDGTVCTSYQSTNLVFFKWFNDHPTSDISVFRSIKTEKEET